MNAKMCTRHVFIARTMPQINVHVTNSIPHAKHCALILILAVFYNIAFMCICYTVQYNVLNVADINLLQFSNIFRALPSLFWIVTHG